MKNLWTFVDIRVKKKDSRWDDEILFLPANDSFDEKMKRIGIMRLIVATNWNNYYSYS